MLIDRVLDNIPARYKNTIRQQMREDRRFRRLMIIEWFYRQGWITIEDQIIAVTIDAAWNYKREHGKFPKPLFLLSGREKTDTDRAREEYFKEGRLDGLPQSRD